MEVESIEIRCACHGDLNKLKPLLLHNGEAGLQVAIVDEERKIPAAILSIRFKEEEIVPGAESQEKLSNGEVGTAVQDAQ